MRIALLPDTRPEAGLGHLRRCQALASALERLGCECMWPALGEAHEADVLVVDHYEVRPEADYKGARHLRIGVGVLHIGSGLLVQFDDNQLLDNLVLHNPADIVINGAPGAESLPYRLRDGATALLGPQYLCLDPAIPQLRRKDAAPEVRRIIVSLGANPPAQTLDGVIFAVLQGAYHPVEICVCAGPVGADFGNGYILPINLRLPPPFKGMKLTEFPQKTSTNRFEGTILTELPTQTNIVKELSKADLAITGGGQTMLEAVALGVPTIVIVMGDNQRAQVEHLFAEGVIEGGIPWDSPHLVPSLRSCVQMVVAQTGLRQYMSETGRRLIDGKGAERVARVIVERIKGSH